MADEITSYRNFPNYGTPAFEVLDTFLDANLVAGAEPAMQPSRRILLGDSLNLAAFTVVGISNGRLVAATWNGTLASAIRPVGVLLHAAQSGASNATVFGEFLPTGCFNAGSNDAGADSPLVWHSSFDTLAKKTIWEGVLGNPMLVFRSRLGAGNS